MQLTVIYGTTVYFATLEPPPSIAGGSGGYSVPGHLQFHGM